MHNRDCTGCPECSELALAILANPTNPVLREAMGRPHVRATAERALRTAATTAPAQAATSRMATASHDVYANPPDPYAAGLAKLRAARGDQPLTDPADRLRAMAAFREQVLSIWRGGPGALSSETTDVHRLPPDSYAEALAARRGRR